MATEIRRERAIGLFKPSPEAKMKAKRTKENFRDKRPGMSDDHLACIRKLPCCTCPRMPGRTAHHLKDTPTKSAALDFGRRTSGPFQCVRRATSTAWKKLALAMSELGSRPAASMLSHSRKPFGTRRETFRRWSRS